MHFLYKINFLTFWHTLLYIVRHGLKKWRINVNGKLRTGLFLKSFQVYGWLFLGDVQHYNRSGLQNPHSGGDWRQESQDPNLGHCRTGKIQSHNSQVWPRKAKNVSRYLVLFSVRMANKKAQWYGKYRRFTATNPGFFCQLELEEASASSLIGVKRNIVTPY